MARVKRIPFAPEYQAASADIAAAGDENACFPAAIALLTGLELPVVLQAFSEAGRKTGQATPWGIAREAVKALGYKMVRKDYIWTRSIIESYPGVHKTLQNITTRHPVRFAKQWEGQTCLLHVDGHVAAVVDGRILDWSANRAKRVIAAYDIVKL